MSSEREIALLVPRFDLKIEAMTLDELEAKSTLLYFLEQWGEYDANDQGWEVIMKERAEIDEAIRKRKAQQREKG